MPLGDSSTVRVGATVVTIGNAGGVGGTPSAATGSVDALNRSITAGDSYEAGNTERLKDVIQINGSLEPGDSGGPLTNTAGQGVGLTIAGAGTYSGSSVDLTNAYTLTYSNAAATTIPGSTTTTVTGTGTPLVAAVRRYTLR